MVEFENFGWAVAISFCGTTFFALYGAWGLIDQIKKLWAPPQSGEAVSVKWFSVYLFVFLSNLVYGTSQHSLALIIHSFCRVPFYPIILFGLWKFKGFTRTEWTILAALSPVLLSMVFLPYKAAFFVGFSCLGVAAALYQPWEIWREKSSGVVSLKLLAAYTTTTIFWFIYGLATHDRPLWTMARPFFAVYSLTIVLWVIYRKPPKTAPAT